MSIARTLITKIKESDDDNLYDDLNQLDNEMIENEGQDIRIDFPGNYSLWFRSADKVIEGSCPRSALWGLERIMKKYGYRKEFSCQ